MGLTNKIKKRILIFFIVPILASIQFFTHDFILQVIAASVLVIYVGFIIFLRDSVRVDEPYPPSYDEPDEAPVDPDGFESHNKSVHETDEGEGFEIVSRTKKIEVITSDNYTTDTHSNRKDLFKPPNLKENFQKIANEELPDDVSHDEQFSFVLGKLLSIIKESFLAHTAIFFWYNAKKSRLTLERYVSSSNDITEQKFDIEDDILSKIVQREEPELLTDITSNAEKDVIRYYGVPQGIKSFVGVPLFYGKQMAGLLALDSKASDAFGVESIYSLGRFVRVISIIISLFEDKFAESQSEQRLKALLGVLTIDKRFDKESELYSSLENAVTHLLHWDAFTFIYYNPSDQKFRSSKIVNKTSLKYIGEHLEIDLSGTLVGKAIMTGMPIKIDDTSTGEYHRFVKNEDVSFDGSFLAIPLVYDNQNYGVLCFESLKKNVYSNEDVKFMKSATRIFAFIVYSFSTQNILKGLLSVDIETKMLNYDSFVDRLGIELIKLKELDAPGAVALIQIDEFLEEDSLFEGDPFPKVLKAVANMVAEETTEINFIGRLSDKIFGVYFFNTTTKDVFLWAEKLRIKIARKPISVVSKQTTFTVSIGVAATTNRVDVDEILHNAELALNKAIEKGGNTVKSIN